jgi:hypothetical protein
MLRMSDLFAGFTAGGATTCEHPHNLPAGSQAGLRFHYALPSSLIERQVDQHGGLLGSFRSRRQRCNKQPYRSRAALLSHLANLHTQPENCRNGWRP